MIATIAISVSVFVLFLLSVFLFPQIKIKKLRIETFWIFPILGVIALLASSNLTVSEVWANLSQNTSVNPLKILVLFFSMTVISIYLDEAGFFKWLATKTASKSQGKQSVLFYKLYIVISILTVFTSNDIIILTFTPFICYFCKNAKISPLPYLIMEFVAANTWSLFLMIGNPTNIYLASFSGMNFLEYTAVMALPTVVAGVVSLIILRLLFRKHLAIAMEYTQEEVSLDSKFLTITSFIILALCVILLAISSFLPVLEMWYIALGSAVLLIIIAITYRLIKREKPKTLFATFGRLPWLLIPFVIAMFIIVQALTKFGITDKIATLLDGKADIWTYGVTAFFSCNILNNIPMSVLFANIATTKEAVYAVIIASNIGALLTPVGALAGIMWNSIITKNEIPMSMLQFMKYGAIVSIPTLLCSLGALWLIML